ncbi:MAG: DUF4352 domain-containing protein [Actinomycetia bacterium]|nr:DUF4352 domain-containing protein [Actinomycetes bacterium]
MKTWIKSATAAAALLLAAFVTLAEADSSGDDSSSGDSSSSEASSESGGSSDAPASSTDSPIPIGTNVEVAKGWNLTVNSAELDANAAMAAANQFNTPADGSQYVMVNMSITNNSDAPAEPMFEMKLSLLPPSGVGIDPAFVAEVPEEIDQLAQLQPGATMTGNMVFEVPVDQIPGSVLLGQSQFTLDEVKDQKFFALQ